MPESDDPRFLLLETSTRVGLVAVAQGRDVLGVRRLEESRRHARDLAPAVHDLLAEQNWRPRSLSAVIVSKGPGSYTGLRVGIMSARAFGYATGCSVIGVETFAALAAQAPAQVQILDVFADAQQDRVYVQRFERSAQDGEFHPVTALVIRLFAEWLAEPGGAPWVTGPGLRGKEQRLPAGVSLVEPALWDVLPSSLLQLGAARLMSGASSEVWTLAPLYLRPSAAEQQWDARPAPPVPS